MQSQQSSPGHELVSVLTDGLRMIQRRRDQRRAYRAEAYAGPASPTPAAPSTPAGPPPRPGSAEGDPMLFRPVGYVEMNGRAVAVMDPATLERLQEMAARGVVPTAEFFNYGYAMDPTAAGAVIDPQAASTVGGFRSASGGEPAPSPAPSDAAVNEKSAAADPPSPVPTPPGDEAQVDERSAEPHPVIALAEQFFDRRADEEAARLGGLLREHEARLAQQAEAAAKQQAALLREALEVHRAEQAEQTSRHAQVVRDLLREHQCQLDERTMAAVTRESQLVGNLLREHRDAITEANEAHRQALEEILEHHRGQSQPGTADEGDKLHAFLAEQVKLQRESHALFTAGFASLTAKVEQLGLAVRQLAEHAAEQRHDLSWLPPPSFVPPLPEVPPTSPPAAGAPLIPPTIPAASSPPLPASRLVSVAAVHAAPMGEARAIDSHITSTTSAASAIKPRLPASTKSPDPTIERKGPSGPSLSAVPTHVANPRPIAAVGLRSELDSVDDLMDEVRRDDDDEIDVEPDDPPTRRLGPLTPLPAHA